MRAEGAPVSDVVVVAGARTPFTKLGGPLSRVHVTELARVVMQETLYRGHWSGDRLDEVVLGNVAMPADAPNPARVAAHGAGVSTRVPAFTVHRNCASGMEAIADAAARIANGRGHAILAGGAESMSGIPLLFPPESHTPFFRLTRARTAMQKGAALLRLRPRHFRPVAALEAGLSDPICGLRMGQTAEVLAHEFGITRRDQDEFALRSHQRAAAASAAGRYTCELVPVYAGHRFAPVTADLGPRAEQSPEALAKLPPIFDRKDGSVTVGNSCQVTDGAAAVLVMDATLARAEGLKALGYVRGYACVGVDPAHMGLGPVFALDRLLRAARLTLSDIDVFEINEAFAAQVLACLQALASARFAETHLNRPSAWGQIDPARLNVNGGAIALGHPVGATGARLVLSALHEMQRRDAEFGIAALCVGGGQGAAILLGRR